MLEKLKPNDTWLTFALVLLLVTLVGLSISAADLVRSINMRPILVGTGVTAVITGCALAKSRFPALTASIYAIVYGVFFSGYFVGRSYADTMLWRERITDIVIRQIEFFTKAFQGSTNRDALIFVVHTAIVIWILGVTAAWWTFRRPRPWLVVLPTCLTMLSVIYYASPELIIYLAIFCLVALLYIAQTHLLDNKKVWQRASVRYNSSISGNFVRSSLVVALLTLAIVWRAPALPANASVGDAINRVNEPWRQVRDNWQRLYSALNAQASGTSDPYRDTLSLGGPRNPTNTPIMDVFVEERLPYAYWRNSVLDRYDAEAGIWRVAEGETIAQYPDDDPLNIPDARATREYDQIFVNYIPNAGAIYAAPELIASDRQILVKTDYDPSGRNVVSASRSRYLLQLNDRYEVTSRLSVADQTSLRNASTNYPAHIAEQYTVVPEQISQRVRDLGSQLADGYDNPYDIALSVQNYLRNTIEYDDQIDPPPNNVEPIDYFLFESQTGYCNYYASSFAMLLRTQGIPTRLSRGFASGEFNEDNNVYRVRGSDAHTWPEAYFPGYGWIQFEPTVVIEPVERPVGEGDDFPAPGGFDEPVDEFDPENLRPDLDENNPFDPGFEDAGEAPTTGLFGNVSPLRLFGSIFALVTAAVLILVAQRMNRNVEKSVEGSYGRLELWGRWLRLPLASSQTPLERASLFATTAPESAKPVRVLIDEFIRKQFSPHKMPRSEKTTISQWRVLRPILFKSGLRQRLSWRPKRKKKS